MSLEKMALKTAVIDMLREHRELRRQRDELWALLDNIDTLDDVARDNDAFFRRLTRVHFNKRFAIYTPPDAEGEVS